jgi:hypothetical protein
MGARHSRSNKMTRSGGTSSSSKQGSRASLPTLTGPTGSAGLNRPKTPSLEPAPNPDPGGVWERAVRKLAKEANVNADDLLDEFAERAAIKTYLGCMDVQQANAEAFDLVRARLFPQLDLAS